MSSLVKLIHWHAAEAREHARRLEAGGFAVDAGLPAPPVLLRRLRRKPPAVVVISLDRLPSQGRDVAGYSGKPLPKKLGLKPGLSVALLGAPPDFDQTLGVLPAGARLTERASGDTGLALWFVRSRREFGRGLTRAVALGARLPVWVVSPKKSGPLATDLSQNDIREARLAKGLVDYKVCAVDFTWSGLLFRGRRKPSDKLNR